MIKKEIDEEMIEEEIKEGKSSRSWTAKFNEVDEYSLEKK